MEDSESLRKQIQLLEDLISRHKNSQGNLTSAVQQRNFGQTVISRDGIPHLPLEHSLPSSKHHPQQLRSRVTWKNRYSWMNQQLGCSHNVPESAEQKLQDNVDIHRNVVQTSSSQVVTGLQKPFLQPSASCQTVTVVKEPVAHFSSKSRKHVWHQTLDRECRGQSLAMLDRKNIVPSSVAAKGSSLGQLPLQISKKSSDQLPINMEKRNMFHSFETEDSSSCGHLCGIVDQKGAIQQSWTVTKRSPGKVTASLLKKNSIQQTVSLDRKCSEWVPIAEKKKTSEQSSVSASIGHVGQTSKIMTDRKGTELFATKRLLWKTKPEVTSGGKAAVVNKGTLFQLKPKVLHEGGCKQSVHSLQSISPVKLPSRALLSKCKTTYSSAADSSVPLSATVKHVRAVDCKKCGSPNLGRLVSKQAAVAVSPLKYVGLKGQHLASPDKSRYTWTKKTDSPVQMQMHGRRVSEESVDIKAADNGFHLPASSSLHSSAIVLPAQTPKRKVIISSKLLFKEPSEMPLSHRNTKCQNAKYTWVAKAARCGNTSRKSFSPKTLDSAKKVISGAAKNFRPSSKYTWIAKTALSISTSNKLASPQALSSAKKNTMGVGKTSAVKLVSKGSLDTGVKKTSITSRAGTSTSKYQWKASGASHGALVSKSMYKWKCAVPKPNGVAQVVGSGSGSAMSGRLTAQNITSSLTLTSGCTSSSHYKLKSRTKLIRRRSSSNSPVDKKGNAISLMIKNRYSLWRKTLPHRRSPLVVQKTSPKGFVQLSKHKLQRLPATQRKGQGTGSNQLKRPSSSKVIKTKYKIVKKNLASSPSVFAASSLRSPLWRNRHGPSTRSVQLNRTQHWPFFNRSQGSQHRWKNRGIRCIGGVMYSVSPNKLSRTSNNPATPSFLFTRRLDSAKGSPTNFASGSRFRVSTSRSIESRAVQRSLAIIRQVKQKEKKKEYCMYYNRFGKCNRGEKCTFIHDPEKIAVCTQFLRGTCKKTDGTCIFSHKVSKDKMPVCSYFLRGICNNSNCPYSHVYVSRKADICQDFLKGYCPEGTKCKKKHTLTCSEFIKTGSCPRGSKCRLLHVNRKNRKRSSHFPASHEHSSTKRTKHRERQRFTDDQKSVSHSGDKSSIQSGSETPVVRGLAKLPSFISLRSSSSSDGVAESETEAEEESKEPGRTIQIKPRL